MARESGDRWSGGDGYDEFPEPLASVFEGAGLLEVETHALEIQTEFRDFDDYWRPFLAGAWAGTWLRPVPG